MIDYSYYPFLKGSLQHRHINQFDEQSILYAQDNIEKYTPTKQLELDIQVWLISTIMLRCLNNNFITRKFVSNYSKLFEYHLTKDFKNKEIRTEILDYFGIKKKDIEFLMVHKVEFIKIHVLDYLEILEKTASLPAPQFHIKQLPLSKGFVYLETQRFIYLLRLVLEQRLISKIKSMKAYTDNKTINDCVSVLKEKYPQEDQYINLKNTSIAPTIQQLITKAYETHHLDHRERIRLGIYLQGRGFSTDYILEIFKQLSDYKEKVTRYQLESLKKYIKT